MHLHNTTQYKGTDLRRLFAAVAARELDPEHVRRLRIMVKPGHKRGQGDGVWGHAGIGRRIPMPSGSRLALGTITLYLSQAQPPEPWQVAWTFAHEVAHARGLSHRDMRESARWTWSGTSMAAVRAYYAWVTPEAFPVRLKPPVVKVRPIRCPSSLKAVPADAWRRVSGWGVTCSGCGAEMEARRMRGRIVFPKHKHVLEGAREAAIERRAAKAARPRETAEARRTRLSLECCPGSGRSVLADGEHGRVDGTWWCPECGTELRPRTVGETGEEVYPTHDRKAGASVTPPAPIEERWG